MTGIRYIDEATIARLLTPDRAEAAVRQAMLAIRSGAVAMPQRLIGPVHDHSGYLGLMPGSAIDPPVYGAKVVKLHPANPDRGLPFRAS